MCFVPSLVGDSVGDSATGNTVAPLGSDGVMVGDNVPLFDPFP